MLNRDPDDLMPEDADLDDVPDERLLEDLAHGDLCADGSGRWCAVHGEMHGPGSMCEHWPRWVVEEIWDADAKFRALVIEHLKAGDRSTPVICSAVSLGILPRSALRELPPVSDDHLDDDEGGDRPDAFSVN